MPRDDGTCGEFLRSIRSVLGFLVIPILILMETTLGSGMTGDGRVFARWNEGVNALGGEGSLRDLKFGSLCQLTLDQIILRVNSV